MGGLKNEFLSPYSNLNELKQKAEAEKLIHDASTEFDTAEQHLTKLLEEYHTAIANGDPTPDQRSHFLRKCSEVENPTTKVASVKSKITEFYREDIVYLPLVMVELEAFDNSKMLPLAEHFRHKFNQQFFQSKAEYLKDVEKSDRADGFNKIGANHLDLVKRGVPNAEGWEAISDSFVFYEHINDYVETLNAYGNEEFAHAKAKAPTLPEDPTPGQTSADRSGSTGHAAH